MTQDDLAAALGIEQGAVSLIENARSNPTILMLDAIAAALEVHMADLFDEKARSHRTEESVRRSTRRTTS
ncbi:helix-turn-helix transcriptional regulator [Bradyrhizobium sp. 191]|uniref:helix-turn-helix transcriptional regulator n=1 Tax=Bradyrhizobium sp. 191 TaxID=2782659 RepID=UPI001FFC1ECF|nr:helix-turn-helix transcriptional regulator [Bradyrhizobium sp. 191]MCK1707729.1 helix-turn-helix transcriptional regulator [Bradyrhizobium sp. 143]MCK1730030.1 helix-turn-helix transcriptional regulator [Bradyrhizobium sp. 142]UPJ68579.1 helix-turn-helix transcriptional regulator [Bradyrhizobium sp. 191]